MKKGKSNEIRETAKRLRVEGKKTFDEIASMLQIDKGTVCRWAKSEGWPCPKTELSELRHIVKRSRPKEGAADPKPEPHQKAKPHVAKSGKPQLNDSDSIDKLADRLLRWSLKIIANAAEFSPILAVKLGELSAKIWLAKNTANEEEIRTMQEISAPKISETYRERPTVQ